MTIFNQPKSKLVVYKPQTHSSIYKPEGPRQRVDFGVDRRCSFSLHFLVVFAAVPWCGSKLIDCVLCGIYNCIGTLLFYSFGVKMRTGSMCFSILQVPRCRIPTLATFWRESFHSLSRTDKNSSSFRPLGSNIYGLERGYNRKWTQRPVFTNAEGRNKTTQQSKPSNIGHEILDGLVSKSDTFSVNKTEISQFQNIEYCDIRQKIAENKELASLVTVIVFDIETTGFSRENERIIEIALRDLEGGENSTFQTLVNPQRFVPNSHVHGITTRMVNKPDVPRMEDLIPILLQFVRSRQKPGGYVVLAAHNARSFDVPFLRSEFTRCKAEFPSNWLFVDTLTLAREMMKSKGEKSTSISLQALRQSFEIPLTGKAHRAMADVDLLSIILPRLTFVLKWSISDLIMKSFLPSDSPKSKKKSLR